MSDIKITKGQLIQGVLKYENSFIWNPTAIVNGEMLPYYKYYKYYKYYQDGKRCLIGQVLSDLGVSDDALQDFDVDKLSVVALPVWADDEAAHLALDLQVEADQGVAWRDAIWSASEEGGF